MKGDMGRRHCLCSSGIKGTGIVHVTGRTEGTGIVYTAMGQGTRLCTQLWDRRNWDRGNWDCPCNWPDRGNWDCIHSYGTGNSTAHIAMGLRELG